MSNVKGNENNVALNVTDSKVFVKIAGLNEYFEITTEELFTLFHKALEKDPNTKVKDVIDPVVRIDCGEEGIVNFDITKSVIDVKLKEESQKAIIRAHGDNVVDKDGYAGLFTNELFELYRRSFFFNKETNITDVVNSDILIDKVFLIKDDGHTIKKF